tara:strand:+ start:1078 stop:1776 length:699 start_codon:yes stop_codon:yes gene_type:complete
MGTDVLFEEYGFFFTSLLFLCSTLLALGVCFLVIHYARIADSEIKELYEEIKGGYLPDDSRIEAPTKIALIGHSLLFTVILFLGYFLLEVDHNFIIFCYLTFATFSFAITDRLTMTIPFPLVSCFALGYVLLTFYYNLFFLEPVLLALIVGFLISVVISFLPLSNKLLGNGDLYVMSFVLAMLHGNLVTFMVFIILTSIIFVIDHFRHGREKKPMGFALHLSSSAVLLHHLN